MNLEYKMMFMLLFEFKIKKNVKYFFLILIIQIYYEKKIRFSK